MTDWEKRARDLAVEYDGTEAEWVSLAVRLGREMVQEAQTRWQERESELARVAADARAEEIAKAIDEQASHNSPFRYDICAHIARSTISKPKTREQVLEEALQRIKDMHEVPYPSNECTLSEYRQAGWDACRKEAARALDRQHLDDM